jgi:hypothetical protein
MVAPGAVTIITVGVVSGGGCSKGMQRNQEISNYHKFIAG